MRRASPRATLAALLGLAFTGPASGEIVTIAPSRDNTIFEDATGSLSNGSGPVLFAGNSGQGLARRALLRFELTGQLPPGATIHEVALTLTVSNAPNATPRSFALHRVLRDWGEGASSTTSGSGTTAAENDATWLHTHWPGSPWPAAGGHFEPDPCATLSVGDVGVYTWSAAAMADDVRLWLEDPGANHGWLLLGDEVTLNTARRFESRESASEAMRPSLTITYSQTLGVGDEGVVSAWLAPCWPNPARGTVRFRFALPSAADARLEILDVAGRRIATPPARRLGSGEYEAAWDGRAPAGVYVYRLLASGRTLSARRLIRLP